MPAFRIVEGDSGSKTSFRFDAACPTGRGEFVCGSINVARAHGKILGRIAYYVRGVHVNEDRRRQGIATALYTAAAQEACRRRGRLASLGENRNPGAHSHDFWAKQAAKGRAIATRTRGAGTAPTYVLTDCPVTTLARPQGRR